MSKYSVKRGEDNAYQVVDDALYETLKANFTNPKCFAIDYCGRFRKSSRAWF